MINPNHIYTVHQFSTLMSFNTFITEMSYTILLKVIYPSLMDTDNGISPTGYIRSPAFLS